jgi:hypothetical protein
MRRADLGCSSGWSDFQSQEEAMGFSNSAAPTRANIEKRLRAADEALHSAGKLIEAAASVDYELLQPVRHAEGAVCVASQILKSRKGQRR